MSSHYKKILIGVLIGFSLVSVSAYAAFPILQTLISDLFAKVKSFTTERAEIVDSLRQEIFASPLRSTDDDANAELTADGAIFRTNAERIKLNLPPLATRAELTLAAKTKLDDMFRRQYFEHVSPDGRGPGLLAEQAGYDYVIVGENLALGNFKDDEALVAAWMASPGHRANIMSERFTEIGIAVGRGTFQGKTVWLAVQEFGRPLSDCPRTDPLLRTEIDRLRLYVDSLSADLSAQRQRLNTMPHNTPEETAAYNQAVGEYNAGVVAYDAATKDLRQKIDEYNAQVRAFNTCIKR